MVGRKFFIFHLSTCRPEGEILIRMDGRSQAQNNKGGAPHFHAGSPQGYGSFGLN